MQKQIAIMLELQDSMNVKVHPEWREQHFEWYRAIWVESAELMDHYGWKWWKKQTPDMEQVKLEIIDIWHFGLSMLLQEGQAIEEITANIQQAFGSTENADELLTCTEAFAQKTLANEGFDLQGFYRLLKAADMQFDDLYCGYVGKNVLNFFRQDHGYKEGTYKKLWQDREDNEHLVEVVNTLDHTSETFKDDLYAALTDRYANA